ncbi:hypothetical protein CEV32_3034 [Brucella rhizosphaerae]|uniref:Uncharacterized protein n=1 Tax=Brucella rhizosphaerae TaxID=571254 RepID=A0A256FV31_9HYPH|nr:hypothetical protein CEV32_3034 [Brucella rhizosphaerae]
MQQLSQALFRLNFVLWLGEKCSRCTLNQEVYYQTLGGETAYFPAPEN